MYMVDISTLNTKGFLRRNNNCIFIIKQGSAKHVHAAPYVSLDPGKPGYELETLFRDPVFKVMRTREVPVVG